MTDRHYDSTAGEFVDYATLDDWAARDAAKDALIETLQAKLDKFENMTILDFANYISAKQRTNI